MASFIYVVLVQVCAVSGTPIPKPGPKCVGAPIANESGLVPICKLFLEHNASCAADEGPVEHWEIRTQFHVGSQCHGQNDPNGPVYYKGVYHLFFQDHVQGGTVGGHVATRDFINWKRLPIALWNDKWYDKSSVWTFSATVVDGVPVMVYPGIAGPNSSLEGMTHNVALPVDPSDPWLVDWMKPDYNPIIMGTNRDPSTAWRTKAGEWRYTSVTLDIYSSWDFKSWKIVGNMDTFGKGECPDFFPVPRHCVGCTGGANFVQPTHVHANVGYTLGTYEDGKPNTTGIWTPLSISDGLIRLMDGSDSEYFYASKSFFDPVKQRRIVWGWVKLGTSYEPATGFLAGQCPGVGSLMANTNSLPREALYDPLLQQLTFFPIDEMTGLRDKRILQQEKTKISGRVPLKMTRKQFAQSEIRVSFAIPKAATRIGLSMMTGAYGNGTRFGTDVFLDFVPNANSNNTWKIVAGFDSTSMGCPRYQRRTKVGDGLCPLKKWPMMLKQSDQTIDIALWVDNFLVEAFFMGGRAAWTIPLPCSALSSGSGVEVFATSEVTLLTATAWTLNSINYENEGPSTIVV